MTTITAEALLTIGEVADLTKRSASSVRTDVREGRLTVVRLGRSVRVHPDDLALYLDAARGVTAHQ